MRKRCHSKKKRMCSKVKKKKTSTEYMLMKVLVTQLGPTLCNPMDCTAHQAPLSMGFSRQVYWGELAIPSPGDLPHTGIEPRSCTAGRFFTISAAREAH